MRIISHLLLYLCIAFSCNSKTKLELTDLSRDTLLHLTSKSSNPTTIILKVTGFANDTFMLQGFLKIPGGTVDSTFKLDCYTKDFFLSYKALKVTKGNLTIEYIIP